MSAFVVGPDDFGGSDFDCGFETGWQRQMREHLSWIDARAAEIELDQALEFLSALGQFLRSIGSAATEIHDAHV